MIFASAYLSQARATRVAVWMIREQRLSTLGLKVGSFSALGQMFGAVYWGRSGNPSDGALSSDGSW